MLNSGVSSRTPHGCAVNLWHLFSVLHHPSPLMTLATDPKIILSLHSMSLSSLMLLPTVINEMNKNMVIVTSIPYSFCFTNIWISFCILSGDVNLKGFTLNFYMSFCGLNEQKWMVATPTKAGHSIGDSSTHNPLSVILKLRNGNKQEETIYISLERKKTQLLTL